MESSDNGSQRSLGGYRDYLLMLARLHLGRRLQGKLDASDVVQQAILRAHDCRAQFRGANEAEWLGWLRAILASTLAATIREFNTAARDLTKERSLEEEFAQSSSRLEGLLAASQSTPSEAAMRSEEILRLTRALASLPEDQRRVVELRHLRGLSIAQVAYEMKRTRPAVAGLLFRALNHLRELLREAPERES